MLEIIPGWSIHQPQFYADRNGQNISLCLFFTSSINHSCFLFISTSFFLYVFAKLAKFFFRSVESHLFSIDFYACV